MKIINPKRIQEEQQQTVHHLRWYVWLLGMGLLLWMTAMSTAFAWSPTLARVNAAPNLDVLPGCRDLIEGGDFEQFDPSWQIIPSTRPPVYTHEQTFSNSVQSLRIGNGFELPNTAGASEVRHKPITLPVDATTLILRFRYYPTHEGDLDGDVQQVTLFRETEGQPSVPLLYTLENASTWKLSNFDLTSYAGQTVSLHFIVRNNGDNGRTLMYIDNVELEYCTATPLPTLPPTLSPTPSLIPVTTLPSTPTAPVVTAVPTGAPLPTEDPTCPNLLANGSFESSDSWYFGEDPVPARYVNTFFQEGARAVLLGNPPENPANVITFSSIRQLVTLPFTSGTIQLRWWRLPNTAQPGYPTATTDRQDLILLAPNLQPIKVLRRDLSNIGIWQEDVEDLTAYRGQTLYIYFNVFNDANNARTWMYLDNVRLRVCDAAVVTSIPTLTPMTATPIAIPLTPNLTYTVIPTLTLSPSPVWTATVPAATVTLTPLPFPTNTETVVAAPTPVMPTAIPFLPPPPTNTVEPLPTLATQTVLAPPTMPLVAPTIDTPTPIANQTLPSLDRLGALGVLLGILVVISIVVMVISRMFQRS